MELVSYDNGVSHVKRVEEGIRAESRRKRKRSEGRRKEEIEKRRRLCQF